MLSSQRNDEDFGEYVRANGGRLLRFAYLQTGDAATAQDVVQTVLARALLSWRRISDGSPDAYLRRAVINERTTLWRRIGRREVLSHTLPDVAVVDPIAITDARHLLVTALRQLPRQQRAAVVLRYLEDLPDEQVAEILGCSPTTVRSHVFRGLARLRPLLGAEPSQSAPERIDL